MNEWRQLRRRLERILDVAVDRIPATTGVAERLEGVTTLPFRMEGRDWLLVVESSLSPRERSLLQEWLNVGVSAGSLLEPPFYERLVHWLRHPEDFRHPPVPKPGEWRSRVPFLIMGKREWQEGSDEVITSFFEGDLWLLPLYGGERLLLVPPESLEAVEGSEREAAWVEAALGLVEALATESGAEVRVVVHAPVETPQQLPPVLATLRETAHIGQSFHPAVAVFAVWDLALERLLHSIGEQERKRFLNELSPVPFWQDGELRRTLHAFLEQNLNVSETARRLFLHRNTLIYRLDRLKQETGLDVRRFDDALLVKLALLLGGRKQS